MKSKTKSLLPALGASLLALIGVLATAVPAQAQPVVVVPPPVVVARPVYVAPRVVVARPVYVAPAGVVYVRPTYAIPGPGYVWHYHVHYGWGWYHPHYGWHRGWR
ncbi:hypothetical protein [Variovorax sp. EL159]|uniref:hypothetical protein n=1 Tax=Variovorax sp. EL159 TaxID=1566270 RepID=UPI00088B29BD|nr:hypothetical protein SAMN03159363_3501 [Variovorax sp. EL159]